MTHIGTPDFDQNDERWMQATELQRRLDLTDGEFRVLQVNFGRAHSIQPKKGATQPYWCFLPAWFGGYATYRAGPSGDSSSGPTPEDHVERLKRAQADTAELNLAKLRGELIPATEVRADYQAVGGKIRSVVEQLCQHCRGLMFDGLSELNEVADSPAEHNGSSNGKQNDKAKRTTKASSRQRPTKKAAVQP